VVRCAARAELYSPSLRGKSVFLQRFTQQIVYGTRLDHYQDGGNNIGMPQAERALIGDVERRLTEKYTALPQDHVSAVVQYAYARFQTSRVRDFIPLLVERRADESDARASRIFLTQKGRKTLLRARDIAHETNARLMEGFSSKEIDIVARWLTDIRSKFPKGDGE